MIIFQYIFWNPNIFIFKIGNISIMWYSIFMLISLISAKKICAYIHKKNIKEINQISLYIIIFALIFSRLFDSLIYNTDYYINNPIEIFIPIKLYPKIKFLGYRGLSYHGAIIGGIIGICLYVNTKIKIKKFSISIKFLKNKKKILYLSTPIAFGFLMGFFIRIGNFINSEIIGTPTKKKNGILFAKEIIQEIKKNSKFIKKIKK